MEEKTIDSMSETFLTPTDFITLMFERTDEDGILYIPGWHYDRPGWEQSTPGSTDENDSYRCRVDWNLAKYEKLIDKFNRHYELIQEIAQYWDALRDGTDTVKNILKSEEHFEFWNTYIRPFDTASFDYEKIADIEDRLSTIEWIKVIAGNIAKGNSIENFEKQIISEYIDVTVSNEEIEYRQKYLSTIFKDAENRIGKSISAYDVVIRSRRLCCLFHLNAPLMIIYNEARELAAAMLLHDYGISKEVVDNNIRIQLERLETMSEEELDELYRPKKVNTRKSMAPLFVFEILTKKSNSKKHLRHKEILEELERYPYEVTLERKALSRIIHNLIDTPQYAVFSDRTGVWIDKE